MAQLKTWHTYLCLWWQTSNHHHCNQHAQKPIGGDFKVILSSSSWSKTTLCIFQEQIWLLNRKCYEKNKLCFDQEGMLKNGLILHSYSFLDVLIPMAQVLRLYIQMFLSYGVYVCIILETAHHRTTFRIFWNITQKTTPGGNSCKMFHISSSIVPFFLWECQGHFWGIRIKFHLWRAKERGKRGYGGRAKMRLFCKIPIIKWDTNFISQTAGQTNF